MLLKSYCEASEDGDWLDIDITHDLEEVEDLNYHNESMAKLNFVKFNPSVNFKRNWPLWPKAETHGQTQPHDSQITKTKHFKARKGC